VAGWTTLTVDTTLRTPRPGGFLITSLLVGGHDASGTVALGRFYLRRLRRLTR